jgi:hypothetical protein
MIRRLSLVALLSALVITGCAARGVRIAELKDQPDRYDDKTVSVTGVVTSSWGIPLVPFQLYQVDDGSGEITVVSRSGRSPSRGARVEVKGSKIASTMARADRSRCSWTISQSRRPPNSTPSSLAASRIPSEQNTNTSLVRSGSVTSSYDTPGNDPSGTPGSTICPQWSLEQWIGYGSPEFDIVNNRALRSKKA